MSGLATNRPEPGRPGRFARFTCIGLRPIQPAGDRLRSVTEHMRPGPQPRPVRELADKLRDFRLDYEFTLGSLARPCLFLSRHAPSIHFSSGVSRCSRSLWRLFRLDLQQDKGCVIGSMLAHFAFNTALALGGAQFGNVLWWSLAGILSVLACWSIVVLSHTSGSLDEEPV
jgi:hypothetical protein